MLNVAQDQPCLQICGSNKLSIDMQTGQRLAATNWWLESDAAGLVISHPKGRFAGSTPRLRGRFPDCPQTSTPSVIPAALVSRFESGLRHLPTRQTASNRYSSAQQHRLPHRLTISNATARHTKDASEALTPVCQSHFCTQGHGRRKLGSPLSVAGK